MTIINNRKATIQLGGVEIKPLGSLYVEDSQWKKMLAEDPIVQEMLVGGFIGTAQSKGKKKENR